MSILDELYQAGIEATGVYGKDPEFLTIPYERWGELQKEMEPVVILMGNERKPSTGFLTRMIAGEVRIENVPILPGTCIGWGIQSARMEVAA